MKKFGLMALLFGFCYSPILPETATVVFVRGKVYSRKKSDKKYKRLRTGLKVSEGTTIASGNSSSATLSYNGSEFKILPNTTMVLGTLPGGKKTGEVVVKKGFTWFKIKNAGKNGFRAVTPTSAAGVRGTSFATMYNPKQKTAMNCICHGKVEVSDSGDKNMMLEKGSGSIVVRGVPGVKKTDYKKDFEKTEVLPSFKKKIKENPILKNCLSCHKTKGWKYKGVTKDSTYGK